MNKKKGIPEVNISSPERLNQYIKVFRPSIWVVLLAIAALLIGVAIWSIWGTIDSIGTHPIDLFLK